MAVVTDDGAPGSVEDVAPGDAGAEAGDDVGPPVVVDGARGEVGAGAGVTVAVVEVVVDVVVVARTGATAGVVTTV